MNKYQAEPAKPFFQRIWFTPLLVCLVLVIGTVAWLGAQTAQGERIGPNSASPAYIVVNTSTPVTFTSVISDSNRRKHDPLKVLLVRTDESGKPIDVLGRMLDSGKRADAKRNDRTYTIRVTLNEPTVGPIYFKVAAKFKEPLVRPGKDDDEDWDRDLAGLNDGRDLGSRRDRLPSLLRKLQGYTLSDPLQFAAINPAGSTLVDVAASAPIIVLATIVDQQSTTDATNRIFTIVTMRIVRHLKGATQADTIAVRMPGGSFGGVISLSPGVPVFTEGETVVILLTSPDAAGLHSIHRLALGTYHVIDSPTIGQVGSVDSAYSDIDEVQALSAEFVSFLQRSVNGDVPLSELYTRLGVSP